MNAIIEIHGYAVSDEFTTTDLRQTVEQTLQKTHEKLPDGLESVDTLYTGVYEHIRDEIEAVIDKWQFDVDVEGRYRRVTDWMDGTNDNLDDWYEAKAAAFSARDATLCKEGYNAPTVDMMILGRDSTGTGAWQARNARRHGVPLLEVSTQEFIDWEAALEADSSSESAPELADGINSLTDIERVGVVKARMLEDIDINTPEDVINASIEELAEAQLFGEATATKVRNNATASQASA
jgi:hypothetical protein